MKKSTKVVLTVGISLLAVGALVGLALTIEEAFDFDFTGNPGDEPIGI